MTAVTRVQWAAAKQWAAPKPGNLIVAGVEGDAHAQGWTRFYDPEKDLTLFLRVAQGGEDPLTEIAGCHYAVEYEGEFAGYLDALATAGVVPTPHATFNLLARFGTEG